MFSQILSVFVFGSFISLVQGLPSLAAFLTGEDYVGLPTTLQHDDLTIEAWVFVTEDNRDASGRVSCFFLGLLTSVGGA